MIPEAEALAVVDLWRQLDTRTAATYVSLIESIPADQPDQRARAAIALLRGLPHQIAAHAQLGQTAAEYLRRPGGPWAPETVGIGEEVVDAMTRQAEAEGFTTDRHASQAELRGILGIDPLEFLTESGDDADR